MSNSPIIPKERLSAYQRWELNSFNEGDRQPAAKVSPIKKNGGEEAEQKAYQRGHAEGLSEGAMKAAADAQNLRALLPALVKHGENINQQLADDLLELALEIARRMVHEALEVRRELIVPIVQDAIAQLVRPLAQPVLTLHPLDAAIVREHLSEQLATDGWKIVEDPDLARGGCKLQTLASQADGTVAVRWQHLAAALGKNTPWIG